MNLNRELTDLERDLSSGVIKRVVLKEALGKLSDTNREIIDLRYDVGSRYDSGIRVKLTGDLVEEFGWGVKEANERVRGALVELGECVREVMDDN